MATAAELDALFIPDKRDERAEELDKLFVPDKEQPRQDAPQPRQEGDPDPSLAGAVARSVAGEIIPSAAAYGGAMTGARLGRFGGLPGMLAGTLVGGTAGYYAGNRAQQGVARAVIGDDEYQEYQRLRQADRDKFPIATTGAELATGLATGIKATQLGQNIDDLAQALRRPPSSAPAVQTTTEAATDAATPPPVKTGPALKGKFQMPEPGPGEKIARTAERELLSRKVSTPAKIEIAAQPSTVRKTYALGQEIDELGDMADDQLQDIINTSKNKIQVDNASNILKARIIDKDPRRAAEIFDQVVGGLSEAGLRLRAYQEHLKTPQGYVASVLALGRKRNPQYNLRAEDQTELGRLFQDSKLAEKQREQAVKFLRDPESKGFLSDEAAKLADAANARLDQANNALKVFERGLFPRSFLKEVYPEAIQTAGLLSFQSLIRNPIYNTIRSVFQGGIIRPLANAMDAAISAATKTERTIKITPTTVRAGLEGYARGTKAVAKGMLTGIPEESIAYGEGVRGSNPLRNFAQAFTGKNMAIRENGKVAFIDRVKKGFDALIGTVAEPTGRLLAVGDVPYRRKEVMRTLAEKALLAGKGSREALMTARFPFKKEIESVSEEAARAVFQQDTPVTNLVNQLVQLGYKIPVAGPIVTRSVLPFAKTPVNVVEDALPVVYPPYGFVKAAYHFQNGDRRKALEAASSAIVGSSLVAAAQWLYNEGLINPRVSKSEKRRDLQFEAEYPGTINLSGLTRRLAGGDSRPRSGDVYSSFEAMGYAGAVLGMYSTIADKYPNDDTTENLMTYALYGLPYTANYTLEQTFLKSTNALLQAISTGEYEKYLQNQFSVTASPVVPAGLVALNRASRKYIPDTKTDAGLLTGFANELEKKFSVIDVDGKRLPPMRGMWGEPVRQTPKGSDPFIANVLDPLKVRSYRPSREALFLYNTWKQTRKELGVEAANALLPGRPDPNIKLGGVVYQLNRKQLGQLHFEVGQRQKALLGKAMDSNTFMQAPADFQREMITRMMDQGSNEGRRAYIQANSAGFRRKQITK